jgi:hypothetical protein
VQYGLSQAEPPSFVDYFSLAGTTITAGGMPVVCYHKAGDDFRLYRFIAQSAAYIVPDDIELVKWEYLQPGVIIERRKSGNLLTEADYEIGDVVPSGNYEGMYVTEVIVPGGKFTGIEGGNRPAFITGGVQQGRIVNIKGGNAVILKDNGGSATAPFTYNEYRTSVANGSFYGAQLSDIDVSLVVLTGPDVAGTNTSKRLWRRVS